MYVGLIDYDLITGDIQYPNLEIMKLSAYHKSKNDIVKLVTDCTQYEQFSKLYFRKNTTNTSSPSKFLSIVKDKVEYGGEAYTNNIYIPLKDEIESLLPDTYIYQYADKYARLKYAAEKLTRMENKNYIRLQTTDDIDKFTQNRFRTLVYDINPLIYSDKFNYLCNKGKKIEVLHGLRYNTLEEFLPLKERQIITADTKIYINTLPSFDILKQCRLGDNIYLRILPEISVNPIYEFDIFEPLLDKIEIIRQYQPCVKFENNAISSRVKSLISVLNEPARYTADYFYKETCQTPALIAKIRKIRRISCNERQKAYI